MKSSSNPKVFVGEDLADSISLPLEPTTKMYLRSNIPLNRCKAFSVSASIGSLPPAGESAIREEQMAWQREQIKQQKVEDFLKKTQERVKSRKAADQEEVHKNIEEIAQRFNRVKNACVSGKIGVIAQRYYTEDIEEIDKADECPQENMELFGEVKGKTEKENNFKYSSYVAGKSFGFSGKSLEISSEGLEEIKEEIEMFYEKKKEKNLKGSQDFDEKGEGNKEKKKDKKEKKEKKKGKSGEDDSEGGKKTKNKEKKDKKKGKSEEVNEVQGGKKDKKKEKADENDGGKEKKDKKKGESDEIEGEKGKKDKKKEKHGENKGEKEGKDKTMKKKIDEIEEESGKKDKKKEKKEKKSDEDEDENEKKDKKFEKKKKDKKDKKGKVKDDKEQREENKLEQFENEDLKIERSGKKKIKENKNSGAKDREKVEKDTELWVNEEDPYFEDEKPKEKKEKKEKKGKKDKKDKKDKKSTDNKGEKEPKNKVKDKEELEDDGKHFKTEKQEKKDQKSKKDKKAKRYEENEEEEEAKSEKKAKKNKKDKKTKEDHHDEDEDFDKKDKGKKDKGKKDKKDKKGKKAKGSDSNDTASPKEKSKKKDKKSAKTEKDDKKGEKDSKDLPQTSNSELLTPIFQSKSPFFSQSIFPAMVTSVLTSPQTAILASTSQIKHSLQDHEIEQAQAKVTAKFKLTQEKLSKTWNSAQFNENSLRFELVRKIADINEHHSAKDLFRAKSAGKALNLSENPEKIPKKKKKIQEKSEKKLRFASVNDMKKQFGPKTEANPSKKSGKRPSKSPGKSLEVPIKVEVPEVNYSTRHLEQLRFSAALKTMVRDKMKEKFTDDIPAVCTCGAMNRRKNLKNPVQCANNCPFYKRQQEFQRALSEMLQSFKATQ